MELCNKAFGSLVYDKKLSEGPIRIEEYQTVPFGESIRLTELRMMNNGNER